MEEAIRKELTELCREIIANEQQKDLDHLLSRTQLLEEKLVLLRYFKNREQSLSRSSSRAIEEPDYDQEIEETLQAAETSRQEAENAGSSAAPISPQPSENTPQKEFSAVSKQSGLVEDKPEPVAEKPPVHAKAQETEAPTPPPETEAEEKPEKTPTQPNEAPVEQEKLKEDKPPEDAPLPPQREKEAPLEKQPRSMNERFVGGNIQLGLNDRLAFMKNLFGGSQEDLNRVVSQLNTFSTYNEAANFLEQMVKPEYNWEDKEEYEERFMFLVKQRFGEE